MSNEEIIKKYHLKELGRENDKDLIEYLRDGQESPLKKYG